jgi:hypothetical protein
MPDLWQGRTFRRSKNGVSLLAHVLDGHSMAPTNLWLTTSVNIVIHSFPHVKLERRQQRTANEEILLQSYHRELFCVFISADTNRVRIMPWEC